ncbi:MAG: AAA family ATPase [Actinomycetes bacterium]
MTFSAAALRTSAEAAGLVFPEFVVDQVVAALDAGKHLMLTGPPGTGKTTLAYLAAELGRSSMLCTGYLPTTATSEWSTVETVGGLLPSADGPVFHAGLFIEAIESGRWLVIDELNRSNFDRAFGQMFTVMSGEPAVLPFHRTGSTRPLSLVPHGIDAPEGTDSIRIPASWRIIATINGVDKHLLYDMSYALMRRFAFIEVAPPDEADYIRLIGGRDTPTGRLLGLRDLKPLGPALYTDAAKYAARRSQDAVTPSRLRYELFYSFFLPQFEGMNEDTAQRLTELMDRELDPPERSELRRVIGDLLHQRSSRGH